MIRTATGLIASVRLAAGVALAAGVLAAGALTAGALAQPAPRDVRIDDTDVYPESVTSTADGTIYAGSLKGNVYRAPPGAATAEAWIRANETNGLLTVFGVLADETSGTLWLCSVPNLFGPERSDGVSSLMAFDLETGAFEGAYAFPPPESVCNDVTIGPDGTAYASDTSNGRIFALAPGADALTLYGEDEALVGIDGLAFSADGVLYVNNVQSNKMFRVETDADGRMAGLTELALSHALGGPDSLRLIDGNRFLQAEGTIGRLAAVTIEGDSAELTVLTDELTSSPGATPVGDTAYVIESRIRYLTDPELAGQDPGEFIIHAVPMR